MAYCVTVYEGEIPPNYFNVTFMVKETQEKLTRSFQYEDDAYNFVRKLKYSKKCVLLSYPNF